MLNQKIVDELAKLITEGTRVLYSGYYQTDKEQIPEERLQYVQQISEDVGDFKKAYQIWFTKASRSVRVLSPERSEEFDLYYTGKKNLKDLNYLDAGITHFLQGIVTTRGLSERQDYYGKFTSGMTAQINILEAIKANAKEILYHLESELYFGLYRSEIEVAKELKKHKQLRAAGAVIGVVIEKHLSICCYNHGIKFRKKNLTISDFNDQLKAEKVVDTIMWRLISRSADIRNYCVHKKEREPTADELEDLIRSSEKIISEIS